MADYSRYIEMVKRQEEILRFADFSQDDALKLALIIERRTMEIYGRPVSVRVDIHDITVFYHLMGRASLSNDWWMKKKLNGVKRTGHCSFYNYLTIEASERFDEFPWAKSQGNIALRGGCFPIYDLEGVPFGYVMTSGLTQVQDHQLVADSLAEFSGKEIPNVDDKQVEFVP